MRPLPERLHWPMWITLLVGVGVVFRVRQYVANRSLWADESFLALELMDRRPAELLQELGFNQGAPFGFLLAQKAVGELAGYSELALRLLPQVMALAALIVFVPLARRIVSADALPLALALVVFADGLIYYASELKQYSGDVFVSVYLLLTGIVLARASLLTPWHVLLAVGAVPLLWLSHPALFVAAAAGVVVAATAVATRRRDRLVRLGLVAVWAVTCLAVVLTVPDYEELREAQATEEDAFVRQSDGFDDPGWVVSLGGSLSAGLGLPIEDPLALFSKLLGAVAILGLVSLSRRDRVAGALLGLSLVITLVVSAFGLYPLYTRTLLFLVPVVALLLSQGVVELASLVTRRRRSLAIAVLSGMIVGFPAGTAVADFVDRRERQELRPALAYVRDHWRRGDVLYVPWGDQYAYLYYLQCDCFELEGTRGARLPSDVVLLPGIAAQDFAAFRSSTPSLVVGRFHLYDVDARLGDLDRLRGRGRVWVVAAHVFQGEPPDFREEALPRRLDRLGRRLRAFSTRGSSAYLYELRR